MATTNSLYGDFNLLQNTIPNVSNTTNTTQYIGNCLIVDSEGRHYIEWMFTSLGMCVHTPIEQLSFYLGLISLGFWFVALAPQVYTNFRKGEAKGLSIVLISEWMIGDSSNLIGGILTGQLPTQIMLAAYFVLMDCVLFSQFMYYKLKAKFFPKKEKNNATSPTTSTEGKEVELHGMIVSNSTGSTGSSSTLDGTRKLVEEGSISPTTITNVSSAPSISQIPSVTSSDNEMDNNFDVNNNNKLDIDNNNTISVIPPTLKNKQLAKLVEENTGFPRSPSSAGLMVYAVSSLLNKGAETLRNSKSKGSLSQLSDAFEMHDDDDIKEENEQQPTLKFSNSNSTIDNISSVNSGVRQSNIRRISSKVDNSSNVSTPVTTPVRTPKFVKFSENLKISTTPTNSGNISNNIFTTNLTTNNTTNSTDEKKDENKDEMTRVKIVTTGLMILSLLFYFITFMNNNTTNSLGHTTGSFIGRKLLSISSITTNNGTDVTEDHGPVFPPNTPLSIFGYCLGFFCATLNIFSRIAQIYTNFHRHNTDGLSPFVFGCAIGGNALYALSIFLYSQLPKFLLGKLPWLISSCVNVCLDTFIMSQFTYYSFIKKRCLKLKSGKHVDEENEHYLDVGDHHDHIDGLKDHSSDEDIHKENKV
ncbi:hypothetical protein ABK040_014023 [Willaertia magna]